MVTDGFLKKLFNIQQNNIKTDIKMADLTSFKIGGPCDVFIEPDGEDELASIIKLCKNEGVPFLLIGAGSNLLVSDKGVDGVVCRLGASFDYAQVNGNKITAGASISLAKLSKIAQRYGLSGLEFSSGIPGSLGGAVFMNAGAYGGEMKDVVVKTEYLDENGELKSISGEKHDFSYRHSFFSDGKKYILSSQMELTHKNPDEIMEKMRDLNARRKEKQPLDKPSAGSTFKRPEGYFAAKLIEEASLKGVSVGDAQVSTKHAGFIVNNGNATAEDVTELIKKVQREVYDKFQVELETEVKLIGR